MTDKERAELICYLRQTAVFRDTIVGREAGKAADELERLAQRNKDLEETVRNLQFEFTKGHSYD